MAGNDAMATEIKPQAQQGGFNVDAIFIIGGPLLVVQAARTCYPAAISNLRQYRQNDDPQNFDNAREKRAN